MINHSCRPNAVYQTVMNEDKTWTVELRSLRELQPDEEITITYMDVLVDSVYKRKEAGPFDSETGGGGNVENNDDDVSFVATRRKELNSRYCFDCVCEECVTAEENIKKNGFDPKYGYHCVKPKCKGLYYVPLNKDVIASSGHIDGIAKCNECGYELDFGKTENAIRKELGLATKNATVSKGTTSVNTYNPNNTIAMNLRNARRWSQLVVKQTTAPALSIECCDGLYELFEKSLIFSRPFERNWEMHRVLYEVFDIYGSPSMQMKYPVAVLRFERMKLIMPFLEKFFYTAHGDSYADFPTLVRLFFRMLNYGFSYLFAAFAEQKLSADKWIEQLRILLPMAHRAMNVAKILHGTDVKRSLVLRDLDELHGSMSDLLTAMCKRHGIPIPRELVPVLWRA